MPKCLLEDYIERLHACACWLCTALPSLSADDLMKETVWMRVRELLDEGAKPLKIAETSILFAMCRVHRIKMLLLFVCGFTK
jgi:hypothetical protein